MSDSRVKMTAEQIIDYIARDYYELSQDKVRWQRDDWKKLCQAWIALNHKEDDSRPKNKEITSEDLDF